MPGALLEAFGACQRKDTMCLRLLHSTCTLGLCASSHLQRTNVIPSTATRSAALCSQPPRDNRPRCYSGQGGNFSDHSAPCRPPHRSAIAPSQAPPLQPPAEQRGVPPPPPPMAARGRLGLSFKAAASLSLQLSCCISLHLPWWVCFSTYSIQQGGQTCDLGPSAVPPALTSCRCPVW